jgi:hypothetical protein
LSRFFDGLQELLKPGLVLLVVAFVFFHCMDMIGMLKENLGLQALSLQALGLQLLLRVLFVAVLAMAAAAAH